MYKNLVGFSAMALLCTNSIAQGTQQDSIKLQELDEVVVSDSRFSLKRENSGKTVIKISAKELERNQGRTVAEIINTKSGLEVSGSRSYPGQNLSVFARGGNNRQVLVIIDGIQVSDPSNVNAEYDLRLLSLAQVETIEIIKGASSTLYGNSAATAVINITTKKAIKDGLNLEVISNWGTNQTQNNQNHNISDISNNVTVTGRKKGLSFLTSVGHQFTDGLSAAIGEEEDVFSRIDGNIKVGYEFSNSFKMEGSAFYNKLNSDYDNGFPVVDADFSFNGEQSRFALTNTYQYKKGEIRLNTALNRITRNFVSDFPNFYVSKSIILDVFNKYTFNDNIYTIVGLNIVQGKTVFADVEKVKNTDPYANLVYVSDFGLNINTGARWNNHSAYGSNWIYNVNPSYRFKINKGYLKFFGSYATSYIAPNLSQLYGPFGANPELNPEEDTTIEGGLEFQYSDRLRFSAVYFNRAEEGRIDYIVVDPDTFVSQYRNISEDINLFGVEVELWAKPMRNFEVTANYTLTDSKNELALRIPRSKLNARISYIINSKAYFSAGYQNVSERSDTDFATLSDVELESFGLIDLYYKQEVSKQFSFFLSIDNVLNEDYVEILNYTTKGRNFRIGMRLKI
ncbi:TonB-dependent receptor [Maribacter sp. PR1]|uniref:TonB-dependent receptor plug domain-containing protein n=1 Tax=Maribacter cobaltidurans TaxID=1178778 RepID=A0ABU7IVH3_9FLAO|nr:MULTISPECIES: TonB-dependent receptor plug domain-containing protein [Maribacter]MDC6389501.1 TonB-dependent receptor [Maribacter sp. PR1]MEE1976890.1 TonB-dependent receptor plug domain-containing protein [Maribacter cobaltidurans]